MNSDEPTIQLGKLSKSSDKKQIQKPLRESLTYRTYIHIHCKCIAHAILWYTPFDRSESPSTRWI